MKKTIVLHLTDFHYGAQSVLTNQEISKLISKNIRDKFTPPKDYDIVIALGGDIANRGNGLKYQYARELIDCLKKELIDYSKYYILCPGNHDIGTSPSSIFSEFNTFSREINPSTKFIFNDSDTCVSQDINGVTFIAINSCYKKDTKYGLIDIDSLNNILNNVDNQIVILTHHHIIPIYEEDTSTTRNSFDFLQSISKNNVTHILHGHIHTSISIKINDIEIVGTSAILPEIDQGYLNSFTTIDLSEDEIYQYGIMKNGNENKITKL